MSIESDLRRGQRAEAILNDDLFKEAVLALRNRALDAFKSAKAGDTDALSQARTLYDVTESFFGLFAGYVRDGQFAQIKAETLKKPAKK